MKRKNLFLIRRRSGFTYGSPVYWCWRHFSYHLVRTRPRMTPCDNVGNSRKICGKTTSENVKKSL